MKYLYESHLGGYYVTDHELSLDERYCETCGDADGCIGGWDDDEDEEAAKAALIEMWEEEMWGGKKMASVETMVTVDDGTVVPKSMVMRWIPVTEDLPDDDRYVLVTAKGVRLPFNARHPEEYGREMWIDDENYKWDNIIAWMELPERYEEGK